MKNTQGNEAHEMPAFAENSPRKARVAFGAMLIVACVGSAFDAARDARSIPQSEHVAPPPLESAERIRFAETERALEELQLDARGGLKIDSTLEAALAQATTHLPSDAPLGPPALQRHRFLIQKALPEPAGSAFADLFAVYAGYRRAAADLLKSQAEATLTDDAQRLARLETVRREYFSPAIADALFGKEERLAEYMIALQRVEQDATLTPAQKAAASAELQRAYEARTQERP